MKKFLILLTTMTVLSCNKGHEIEADFGQEVDVEAVNGVFSKASGGVDPTKAKKGQSITRIVNLRVENSERFRPVFWDRQTLLETEDTADALILRLKVEEKDLSYDPPEEKIYEDSIGFKKVANVAFQKENSDLAKINYSALGFEQKASAVAKKPTSIKYFNLKESEEKINLPEAVLQKPNCLAITDCKMNVHHIEFDEVTWYNDGSLTRVRWLYEISPDVPYLGAVTTVCAAQQVPYQGTQVYVRNCRYVVDFNF